MSDIVSAHVGGGYASELEDIQIKSTEGITFKKPQAVSRPSQSEITSIVDRENRRVSSSLKGLNAHERHKRFIHDYILHYGNNVQDYLPDKSKYRTDLDVLRENYRFIRSSEDDEGADHSWEKRLATKYYNKLFKEYCIGDMSRYKEGKIGLRWRTQNEVFDGKGQFVCGNKRCNEKENLKSFELNFAYSENGERKNALVKLRVCPECAVKLNYKQIKKAKREMKKQEKREKKRRKREYRHSDEEEERKEKEIKVSKEEVEERETPEDKEAREKKEEAARASQAWQKPPETEKSKDEEFDEYFEGMFL